MIPTRTDYIETIRLGDELSRHIHDEIQEAEKNGWSEEFLNPVQDGVRKYFKLTSRIFRWLGAFAFAPLPALIIFLVSTHSNSRLLLNCYIIWIVGLSLLAARLFISLSPIVQGIRKLPPEIYRSLLGPLWANLDAFHVAVSIGLFFYILTGWNITTSFPIIILIVLIWIASPWCLYLLKKDREFIIIKLSQLGVLIVFALLSAVSPVPMSHYQRWIQHGMAEKLRPEEQREVTSDWARLQWFTQEGAVNVWYSANTEHGYRLFSAPGHDPNTNQVLIPVSDQATRDTIINWFHQAEDIRQKQAQQERETRLAVAHAQAEAETQRRLTESKIQDERAKAHVAEMREKLIREYVSKNTDQAKAPESLTALIVLNAQGQHDAALTARITRLLDSAGMPNIVPVFTPAFFESSYFRSLLGAKAPADELFHPEKFAARLLVIKTATVFGTRQPIESVEMRAADTVWDVVLISALNGAVGHSVKVATRGIGFKDIDAVTMATERAEIRLKEELPTLASKISSTK
ncbi:MAG: cell envelope integrity protein TolA [Opitutaceae bacterium]|jgi:hypothetical protein